MVWVRGRIRGLGRNILFFCVLLFLNEGEKYSSKLNSRGLGNKESLKVEVVFSVRF